MRSAALASMIVVLAASPAAIRPDGRSGSGSTAPASASEASGGA